MKVIFVGLVLLGILSACGGDNPIVLKPHPISSEYQGLSMEELKSKSSDISYREILGEAPQSDSSSKGIAAPIKGKYVDPAIAKNIMNHEGTLLWFKGIVQKAYPSSVEGVFTLWACTLNQAIELTGQTNESAKCNDPLFLLYDLDRGPQLKEGDIIAVSGVIVGSRTKKPNKAEEDTVGPRLTPTISVIKALLVEN